MNNMQKAFKKKAGLKAACGMADGGTPTPHHLGMGLARNAAGEMRRRNRAIDNVGVVAPAPQPVAPVGAGGLSGRRNGAVPPAAMFEAQRRGMADGGRPTPHHLGMGLARNAAGEMRRRNRAIDNAGVEAPAPTPVAPVGKGGLSGRRDGAMPPADVMARHRRGMMDGGEIEGPGGPTDDEAGLFALSSEEYVLPADTVDAMGGPEVLDEIRDATHDFVDPKKRGLANGGEPWRSDFYKDPKDIPTLREAVFGRARAKPVDNTVGPANPSWFQKQRAARATEDRAAAAVKAGTADADQQALYQRNQAVLQSPAAQTTGIWDVIPGVSTAARGVVKAAPNVVERGLGMARRGADALAAKFPNAASKVGMAPKAVVETAGKTATTPTTARAVTEKIAQTQLPTTNRVAANAALRVGGGALPATAAAQQGQEQQAGGVDGVAPVADPRFSYQQADMLSRQGAGLESARYKLGGGIYSDGNADIVASSTRRDGKLNNFEGVGTRPNWEERNPADFKAATERAAADKARLRAAAVAHMQSGTADGLDMAYQLAAGDPEAQQAVEAARKEQGLRTAALNGSKEAAALLAQQGKDATDVQVANINAGAETQKGLAAARSAAMKAQMDQRNSDRDYNLKAGKQRREEIQADLEVALGGKQFDKEGNLNPAYADFMASLNETFLSPEMEEARGGKPLSLEELDSGTLQNFIREYSLAKKTEAGLGGSVLNFFTGNSFAPTADMMQNAAEPGTYDKGVFWDTYKTRRGELRRTAPAHGLWGDDLTADEYRRFGGN